MSSDIDVDKKDFDKQSQKNNNKFDKILNVILIIGFSIWIVWKGVQDNDPIVSTIWFIVIMIFTSWFTNKLDRSIEFFKRAIFGVLFMSLLFISYLLYLLIRLTGLDLLQWTF